MSTTSLAAGRDRYPRAHLAAQLVLDGRQRGAQARLLQPPPVDPGATQGRPSQQGLGRQSPPQIAPS